MNNLHNSLKEFFGFSSFRPGQEEIISHALSGTDTLALMPTGGGKSLCYQVTAMMKPGCTIVISPLIALMNDQVDALIANDIPAGAVNSSFEETENQNRLYEASVGRIKLLYISPERFMQEIDNIATRIPVSLVAIDEAHCISQWGHDFRPVYKELSAVKVKFPGVAVMALTATADRLIREDIISSLRLENPFSYIGSFDRPNISLRVEADPGKQMRLQMICSLIEKYPSDAGIVYCLSRKKTEDMHKALSDRGYRSVCYHAGLSTDERHKAQKAFTAGEAQVVCATIAFGMGIDKSNIRWVVHNNIPGNIESYYQEIGRAGRDGLPAEALMFYNFGDIITRRSFIADNERNLINREKLQFMQRYAETSLCRRRILLSYFSQETINDCGNCDNCRAERNIFDGTKIAQMALCAMIRVNNSEGIKTITDILRASDKKEITDKGYHLLRTYGVGRNISSGEWHNYIFQMIQLGLIEVAFDDNLHLHPTALGMKVVKGTCRIELAAYNPHIIDRKKGIANTSKPIISPEEELLLKLKELRKKIAVEENVGDYVIFSDYTLAEMVSRKPVEIENFAAISGVSKAKLAKYGKKFLSVIRKHQGLTSNLPAGSSRKETLLLFNSGISPEEIARLRGMALTTVYSHLIQWADEGAISDFRRLSTEKDFNTVSLIYSSDPENAFLRLQNEYNIPGHIIRAVLAEKRANSDKGEGMERREKVEK